MEIVHFGLESVALNQYYFFSSLAAMARSHATHYLKLSYAMKGKGNTVCHHVDTANRELEFLNAKNNLYSIPLGRFGLFFVFSKFDVPEVIRGHRKRAEEHPGFLDELQIGKVSNHLYVHVSRFLTSLTMLMYVCMYVCIYVPLSKLS